MRGCLKPEPGHEERKQGAEGRLLRGYLHKTSNTLCGIKGYASLIARTTESSVDNARWAEKIIREVERMEAVFRAVGDLTTAHVPGPADGVLADVVARACADACCRHRELDIVVGPVPDAPTLLPAADLALVLAEFLDNSAEGRDGHPGPVRAQITFAVQPTGRVTMTCDDDGPGVLPNLLPKAAEPFLTTKNDRPGIGLTRVETLMDMYDLAWHLRPGDGGGTAATCEVAVWPTDGAQDD